MGQAQVSVPAGAGGFGFFQSITYSYLEWAEVLIEFHGPQIFIMSFYLTFT